MTWLLVLTKHPITRFPLLEDWGGEVRKIRNFKEEYLMRTQFLPKRAVLSNHHGLKPLKSGIKIKLSSSGVVCLRYFVRAMESYQDINHLGDNCRILLDSSLMFTSSMA
jgi:hypothetical protein